MRRTAKLASGATVEFELTIFIKGLTTPPKDIDSLLLEITSGMIFDDPQVFDENAGLAMYCETRVSHNHKAPVQFGYRQVANVHFHNNFYAGIQPVDGSIVDGSTGMNRRWILDPSINKKLGNFISGTTPFAQPKIEVKPNVPLVLKFFDLPKIGNRFMRVNATTGKKNFLVSIRQLCQFFTAFYVVDNTGAAGSTDIALEGFLWEHDVDVLVLWTKGIPFADVQRNRASLVSRFVDNVTRFDGFSVMNVKSAAGGDNATKVINEGMDEARKNGRSAVWQHSMFEGYHPLVAADIELLARRSGFDFSI